MLFRSYRGIVSVEDAVNAESLLVIEIVGWIRFVADSTAQNPVFALDAEDGRCDLGQEREIVRCIRGSGNGHALAGSRVQHELLDRRHVSADERLLERFESRDKGREISEGGGIEVERLVGIGRRVARTQKRAEEIP